MKVLLFISTLILIVSCGKYERPFISFKSPEKRLTEGTWGCTKAVDSAGNEFQVEDRITFSIDGSDSTFERRISMDYFVIETAYLSEIGSENLQVDSLNGFYNIKGNWHWGYALDGSQNKQIMKMKSTCHNPRNMRVYTLSSKELIMTDETRDNTTYH